MKSLSIFATILLVGCLSVTINSEQTKTSKTSKIEGDFIPPLIDDSNTTCKVCHYVIDFIIYEVKEAGKTINDIINLVEDLCEYIGGPIVHKECEYILGYVTDIVNWINHGANSTVICEKLHECPTPKHS